MAAETALVLCQQKQAKDQTLSSSQMWDDFGTMCRDESPCCSWLWEQSALKKRLTSSSQPPCLTCSAPEPSSLTKPSCSLCHQNTGQRPQAQVLSLYIHSSCFGYSEKFSQIFFVKRCRTWFLLDSGFPKFIPSIRPPFDFIPGPNTLYFIYLYLFLPTNLQESSLSGPLGFF